MKTTTLETTYLNQEVHITGHADPQQGAAFFTQTNASTMGCLDPADSSLKIYATAEQAYHDARADIDDLYDNALEATEEAANSLHDALSAAEDRTVHALADALAHFMSRTERNGGTTPAEADANRLEFLATIYKTVTTHPACQRRAKSIERLTQ
jgi:hypothetical protein